MIKAKDPFFKDAGPTIRFIRVVDRLFDVRILLYKKRFFSAQTERFLQNVKPKRMLLEFCCL